MRIRQRLIFVVVLMAVSVIGSRQNASAATTVITNVIPDAGQTSVSIYGQNFCTSPAPQVYMFIPPNVAAGQLLTVTSFGPTLITATLPAASNPAGIYLFFVNCAGVFSGFAAVLDRPGVAGATGATGAKGSTGATGATGPPGSGAKVSVVAPLASSGGPTPVLSLPGVRIDPGDPGNTALGTNALTVATGGSNTASGYQALSVNTTGSYNTATGWMALPVNTTGSYNTATGIGALYSNTTGSANAAIGDGALFANTTGIGNTATGETALYDTTTGNLNTATGVSALQSNTTGLQNDASGAFALFTNTTGSYNTAVGAGADVTSGDLTNATAIGSNAIVNASNKVRIGNTSVTVIEGQVPYTFTSDRNQKERFEPVNGADVLRKLRALPLTSWNYVGQDSTRFRHYGPMAQDFFAAFGHDAVGTFGTDKTINSGDLAGVTLIAVQEVARENEALKARLVAQEERIARLEALLNTTGTK